jgi:hypothetical protein
MLKIKKENVGKRIIKGSEIITLTDDMPQIKLAWIQKYISSDLVEEIDEEEFEYKKAKKNAKKYVEDNEESSK